MFGLLYGKITDLRNALYEKGFFKSYSLGVKTISVGNITVGGTGKTPLVAFIAEILAENGEKVCILTRGYGRAEPKKRVIVSDGARILADARAGGDEPFELANKLLGKTAVIADADRVAAAEWARENLAATAFVLDDAFQHRRARRDLNIVVVDATNPFGNRKILPSGILRENLVNLKRADLFVISRSNLVENAESVKACIRRYNRDSPIFAAANVILKLTELNDFLRNAPENESKTRIDQSQFGSPLDEQKSESGNSKIETKPALAFCALGNAENFFEQLRREKFDLAAALNFPDHHFYTAKNIEKIEREAVKSGAGKLLTTAKDAVKLSNFKFSLPCYVVEIGLQFDDESGFRQMIESA